MILIDSNVPMYLVGADHPHKRGAQQLLESAVARGERLVTDSEVLQEILHRYIAIERRDAIDPAFELVLDIVDEVFPIELADVSGARQILRTTPRLSARGAIHIAVMQRRGVGEVLSFDRAFDGIPGIVRLSA